MNKLLKNTLTTLAVMMIVAGNISIAQAADDSEEVTIPDWVTRMKIKGDIRARFEDVQVGSETKKSRFRERVRIGVYGKVNEQMDFGFRLASGSDESPTSSNQSLDDFSSKRKVWMDLAYFGYVPEELDSLHVVIGKFKKPWKGVSDLVWDGDLNPEGVNAKYGFGPFSAQIGYYVMKDNVTGNNPTTDIGMTAGQFDGKFEIAEDISLHAGVAGFIYSNVKDAEVLKSDSGKYEAKGNSVRKEEDAEGNVTGEYWVNDYSEVDAFASLNINKGPVPVKLYTEYVKNTAATTPDDDGWKVGVKTSLFSKKVALDYNYRDLGQDAVVGLLTDSDFGGGGAGSKGSKVSIKYKPLHNCTLGLTALFADNGIKDETIDTYQADIVVKF